MKKQFLIFLTLLLFLFIPLTVKVSATTTEGFIDYGCPEEDYYSNARGTLPLENILYGSNVFQRNASKTCEKNNTHCTTSYGPWVFNKRCNKDEYCDRDGNDSFYCHLANQCNPDNFRSFPVNPLTPKDNQTSAIPIELKWCSLSDHYSSYKIKLYKYNKDKKAYEQKGGTITTNSSNYCSGDLRGNNWGSKTTEDYKWKVAYCTGLNGSNCGSFGTGWYFKTGSARNIEPPTIKWPSSINDKVSPIVNLKWTPPSQTDQIGSYYIEIYKSSDYFKKKTGSDIQPIWVDVVMGGESNHVGNIYLLPETSYVWRIASCANKNGTACGNYYCDSTKGIDHANFSSALTFKTNDNIEYNSNATLTSPFYAPATSTSTSTTKEFIPLVTPGSKLEWKLISGAAGYKISTIGKNDTTVSYTSKTSYNLQKLWDDKKISSNEYYSWKVSPCRKSGGNCSDYKNNVWKFKTSGGTTSVIYPADGESNVPSELNFRWKNIPDAVSYVYKIETPTSSFTGITTYDTIPFSYGEKAIGENYNWKIKACAGKDGTYCPNYWQDSANFTIADFKAPSNPYPRNGGSLFTYENYISWDPVVLAKAYKIELQYSQKDKKENKKECVAGSVIADNVIVQSNRFIVKNETNCLG